MYFNFEEINSKDRELMLADMNADGNIDIILGPRRVHCKEDTSILATESVMELQQ